MMEAFGNASRLDFGLAGAMDGHVFLKLQEDVDLKMNPYIPGFCLKPLETYSEYLFDQDLNSKHAFSQKLWPVVSGCITKY